MNRKAFYHLLKRYVENDCTEEERKLVEQWYDLLGDEEGIDRTAGDRRGIAGPVRAHRPVVAGGAGPGLRRCLARCQSRKRGDRGAQQQQAAVFGALARERGELAGSEVLIVICVTRIRRSPDAFAHGDFCPCSCRRPTGCIPANLRRQRCL